MVEEVNPAKLKNRWAVVIDTLRATSTIVTALYNGCRSVRPFLTPEEARHEAGKFPAEEVLLAGERNAVPIDGFDLGNSPLEFTPGKVGGKHIFFTTTNGTRALQASGPAAKVLVASLLNVKAVAQIILDEDKQVIFVCAGTKGQFSLEDFITAGAIIRSILSEVRNLNLSQMAKKACHLFRYHQDDLYGFIKTGSHGQKLVELGFHEDLKYCTQVDHMPVVPVYHNGIVTL